MCQDLSCHLISPVPTTASLPSAETLDMRTNGVTAASPAPCKSLFNNMFLVRTHTCTPHQTIHSHLHSKRTMALFWLKTISSSSPALPLVVNKGSSSSANSFFFSCESIPNTKNHTTHLYQKLATNGKQTTLSFPNSSDIEELSCSLRVGKSATGTETGKVFVVS